MRTPPTFVVAALLALAACGSEPAVSDVAPLPALAAVTVQSAQATRGRAWDGVVEAVQQATLTAQTSGRVATVAVDVNDRVEKGQVLLRLSAVEQRAAADAASAQVRAASAAAVEAQANFRRLAALSSGQYVSRAQVDQARAARDSAVAARDAATARLAEVGQQSSYTVVRAPFAGIVSAREVEPGESVVPAQALMALYAPEALRIEVQVPQSDAAAIRGARIARIVLADGRTLEAAQVIVFPVADPDAHSVGVRVLLPQVAEAPQPGITAKVVFPLPGSAGAVRIPAGAVLQRGEISGAYVLGPGNRLALRQLRIGQRIGEEVEVVAGLKAGEKVVLDPVAASLALVAQRKAAAGAGHD